MRHRFLVLHTDAELVDTCSVAYEPSESISVVFRVPAHRRKTERYSVSIWNDLGELCGNEAALTGMRLNGGSTVKVTIVPTVDGGESIWD